MMLQQGQHVGGLIGVGVYPAGLIGAGVKAQRAEPAQWVGGVHRAQQRVQRGAVSRRVAFRRDALVVEVAAAVAGGQQLFARAGAALQHRDAGCGVCLRGSQSGRQPGGPAAQNEDVCHAGTCLSWLDLCLL